MELNAHELAIISRALMAEINKIDKQINKSYLKTGPSERLDRKGREQDEIALTLMKIREAQGVKINEILWELN